MPRRPAPESLRAHAGHNPWLKVGIWVFIFIFAFGAFGLMFASR